MLFTIIDIQQILILINNILENLLKLFDTKIAQTLLGAFIGASVSITVFIGTQLWTSKREKRKQKENVLNVITQVNKELFNIIYEISNTEKDFNYLKLREEYKKIGLFIYMLPEDLKIYFDELYIIHSRDPKFYQENQNKIPDLCKGIVQKINKYGVDIFG
ncbi:hypothetical protein [Priestia megaterium]|uniref:hypothetical protein n=1 Tax=Priestia megaterium TaxID=1404 RepID=UPI002FFEF3F1